MKNLICCLAALLAVAMLPGTAQEKVDKLFFDMRTSFHQELTEGNYTSQLVGEYLNFHILGHLSPTVDYRVRQRLNKKVFDERNMFNATDILYINWQATPRWSFTFGKHAVLIGGYEYDAAPIDVYFYSKFCNNIYQAFTFGASATYTYAPGQSVVAQICNSPLSLGFQNTYAYNLAWCGQFAPWWKTIWSVNFVEDSRKRMVNYIALGNHIQSGDILFDLDLSFKVDRNMARDWLIPGGVGTITQQDNTLFIKLMENAGMRDAFLTRMGELLRGTFSADSVVARFEARRALIAPEIELNCARWKWSSDKWREACDRFVEYAKARPAKLVEYLTMAFQLTDAQAQAYFAGVR